MQIVTKPQFFTAQKEKRKQKNTLLIFKMIPVTGTKYLSLILFKENDKNINDKIVSLFSHCNLICVLKSIKTTPSALDFPFFIQTDEYELLQK